MFNKEHAESTSWEQTTKSPVTFVLQLNFLNMLSGLFYSTSGQDKALVWTNSKLMTISVKVLLYIAVYFMTPGFIKT